MKIFDTQIKHYEAKFSKTIAALRVKDIKAIATKLGVEDLEASFKSNSDDFKKAMLHIASTLVPSRVSCTIYAAVCARVAEEFNVPYEVYAGFCLKANHPFKDKDLAAFKARKEAGDEHPMIATHVYVTANGVDYEYYSGATSDIEHIDCVKIG